MKQLIIIVALLASISSANGAIITPTLNIEAPILITSTTEIFADFGISGSSIDISDLFLTLKFDNPSNYYDANEGLRVSWLTNVTNPPPGITSPAWVAQSSRNVLGLAYESTIDLSMLYIDDNGIGYITIETGGGDGAILNSISLTGNAIITPVPLPPSLWLFASSLILLFIPKTLTRRCS